MEQLMPKQADNEHSTNLLRWATFFLIYRTLSYSLFVFVCHKIFWWGSFASPRLLCPWATASLSFSLSLSLPPVSYPLRCGWFFWSQWCLDINGSGTLNRPYRDTTPLPSLSRSPFCTVASLTACWRGCTSDARESASLKPWQFLTTNVFRTFRNSCLCEISLLYSRLLLISCLHSNAQFIRVGM